jgi:hypothetical protein
MFNNNDSKKHQAGYMDQQHTQVVAGFGIFADGLPVSPRTRYMDAAIDGYRIFCLGFFQA